MDYFLKIVDVFHFHSIVNTFFPAFNDIWRYERGGKVLRAICKAMGKRNGESVLRDDNGEESHGRT